MYKNIVFWNRMNKMGCIEEPIFYEQIMYIAKEAGWVESMVPVYHEKEEELPPHAVQEGIKEWALLLSWTWSLGEKVEVYAVSLQDSRRVSNQEISDIHDRLQSHWGGAYSIVFFKEKHRFLLSFASPYEGGILSPWYDMDDKERLVEQMDVGNITFSSPRECFLDLIQSLAKEEYIHTQWEEPMWPVHGKNNSLWNAYHNREEYRWFEGYSIEEIYEKESMQAVYHQGAIKGSLDSIGRRAIINETERIQKEIGQDLMLTKHNETIQEKEKWLAQMWKELSKEKELWQKEKRRIKKEEAQVEMEKKWVHSQKVALAVEYDRTMKAMKKEWNEIQKQIEKSKKEWAVEKRIALGQLERDREKIEREKIAIQEAAKRLEKEKKEYEKRKKSQEEEFKKERKKQEEWFVEKKEQIKIEQAQVRRNWEKEKEKERYRGKQLRQVLEEKRTELEELRSLA